MRRTAGRRAGGERQNRRQGGLAVSRDLGATWKVLDLRSYWAVGFADGLERVLHREDKPVAPTRTDVIAF